MNHQLGHLALRVSLLCHLFKLFLLFLRSSIESKKPFELVYDRTRVTSKANDLHEFYFVDVVDDYEYHGLRFSTRNTATDDENRVYIEDKLASRSFVVEGLPSGSKEKCTNYRLGDLDIACSGMIKVKEYQAKPN